ncbi:MAG: YceK/YidQ family lipoprotein [Bacteroidales bacterium]|nr:YceK/YidQ family lipoprotein [Bacteroidales bacterium]
MMHKVISAFLSLSLLLNAGCFSLYMRVSAHDAMRGVYYPTIAELDGVQFAWMDPYDSGALSSILFIMLAVDLPLTAALDTVMLPVDFCCWLAKPAPHYAAPVCATCGQVLDTSKHHACHDGITQ